MHLIIRSLLVGGTFSLLCTAVGTAAPPASFELDTKDLEISPAPSRQPRRQSAPPARKAQEREKSSLKAVSPLDADGYTRYTVKPGDFLFKILMREFGLSNAAAEALIPEVQKLNRLPSATRLEVGHTILIPLSKRKSHPAPSTKSVPPKPLPAEETALPALLTVPAPAPTSLQPSPADAAPVPPPAPLAVEATPAAAASSVAPIPPSPTRDEYFAATLLKAWEELVPGQDRLEPLTVNGRALSRTETPVLLGADGSRILVDLRNSLSPQMRSQLIQKHPDIRIVSRGKENDRQFFASLLRTAEFARVEENAAIDLGADPKLNIRADFRIVRLPAASRGPETCLLFIGDESPCLPASLKDYLVRKGYQVIDLCRGTVDSHTDPGYDLHALPNGSSCDMTISLLDALSLRLERNRIVTGNMGAGTENRFSIRVEGYFEAAGKRFILDCGEGDSYNYTLFRLLQLQGYRIIQPRTNDDFATISEKLLKELNYPYSFGRHDLDYGRYRISVTGYKVTRRGDSTGRLILANRPSDPVFAELLKWAPKSN